ncbi:hypothetical protein P152DRAFT_472933 [Eremomyces bilateralis CBS 781.70]|uniref:Uncharacterized protein n=1 Tax=Eremomyces bilateralis CBS 781.70 TaxID=1392243 RepID=A0A6G1G5G1_9PEZI|nr:uncharacterized protein P152DRAFT_472933 [Eremomyces bilateralis CBS 781.70]KAF1813181.1 hypothetical protein P152DRAFT_472933 [Eremomyces bilateralis CBS 781.70]
MREDYYDSMPIIEVDKQIDQLLDNPGVDSSDGHRPTDPGHKGHDRTLRALGADPPREEVRLEQG